MMALQHDGLAAIRSVATRMMSLGHNHLKSALQRVSEIHSINTAQGIVKPGVEEDYVSKKWRERALRPPHGTRVERRTGVTRLARFVAIHAHRDYRVSKIE